MGKRKVQYRNSPFFAADRQLQTLSGELFRNCFKGCVSLCSVMKTLEEKISALEDVIAGYDAQLNEAGISEAKWNRLSDMIKTRSETLNRLLDEKNGQSAGKLFVAY